MAAVALDHPKKELFYGFATETPFFGPAAAVLRYSCLSRGIAPLIRRFLGIPCVSAYDDFGIVAPRPLIYSALRAFASWSDSLDISLETRKSKAGPSLGFLGLTIGFTRDLPKILATMSLPDDRAKKLTKLGADTRTEGADPIAPLQKVAGKLYFPQTAAMGRFGRAALKLIY